MNHGEPLLISLDPCSLAAMADWVLASQMRKPEVAEKCVKLAQVPRQVALGREMVLFQVSHSSKRVGTDTIVGRIRTQTNIKNDPLV